MDIGVHILGSVTSNETPGQKQELRVGTKQDRSGFNGDDYLQQRSLKLARTTTTREEEEKEEDNLSSSSSFAASYCKTMPFHQGIPLLRSASPLSSSDSRRQEHMLSFSDKPEALDFTKYVGLDNGNKSSLSPFLHQIPPPSYFRNSGGGYGSGGMMMNMSMQGNFTSVKGPFTLTQWAELDDLLSMIGWGTFHLGFAGGNMDPEPGRCRRTDGKKWRCSRDAVPDQKYCERHINRGRHRSRKPVEVQSGQTATATAASKAVTTTPQQQPVVTGNSNRRASNSNCSLVIGGGQYINESLPNNNRVRNPHIYPSTVNLQPKESPVIHQKHRNNNNNNNNNPFEFGHISSDSLLNPNADTAKTYGSSYLDFSSNQDKYSGNHNHNSWPQELKSDWTQLSMSIPIASSSSPSSSHNNNNNNAQDKTTLSPLRLSREIDLSIQTEETTMEPAAKKHNE
ncbi:PREDICTED: growth-regulating factor 2-like [Camelina sativa]|uniref:Growth-regulating factor n=1 Tax=Camelina sativa TaxID=90675 RepID=A0ABM1QKI2_CAMSA|nr:PREDICTED: growth-regulating factor 2-like [Camelina sativa]